LPNKPAGPLSPGVLFETAAEYEKVKNYAVEANEQNFDRLAAQLVKM